MTQDLNTFSYAYLPWVYLRWGVCSVLPIFKFHCWVSYCWILLCTFWTMILYHMCHIILREILSGLWLVFSFSCHHRGKVFNFNDVWIVNYFFSWIMPLVLHLKKSSPYVGSPRKFPPMLILGTLGFCILFLVLIHFELILLKDVRSVSRFFFSNLFTCRCPVVPSTVC